MRTWTRMTFTFALLLAVGLPAAQTGASTVHPYVGAPQDQALIDEVLDGWFGSGGPTNVVYVAPPDGNLLGTGTQPDPLRDLIAAVFEATEGTAIYLAPGVYPMSEIRDLWGYDHSVLDPQHSGNRGNHFHHIGILDQRWALLIQSHFWDGN